MIMQSGFVRGFCILFYKNWSVSVIHEIITHIIWTLTMYNIIDQQSFWVEIMKSWV